MAHKQKYTRGATGHMLAHYDRSKEVSDLPMPANTVMNYNLASNDQQQRQLDFIHQRLSEVKVHNRKDVNVMVDWVVTAPKDLSVGEEDRFFKETYKFLNDRYGKENVISAYVHMDETTPHMHYAFVPVVEDRKKGGYKLSAKEAVTREDLRTFHSDLSKHLEKAFGRDVGILNEATKEGNKSIEELKRGAAAERISEAYREAEQIIKATKTESHEILEIARERVRKVQGGINGLEAKKSGLEGQIKALEGQVQSGKELKINEICAIQPQRTFTGAIKGVTVEDIENLKRTAIVAVKAIEGVKSLSQENDRLQRKVEGLEKHVPSLMERSKVRKDRDRLQRLEKAFESLPKDERERLIPSQIQSKGQTR